MKLLIPLLALGLAFTSCKKEDPIDPVVESNCLFTTTNTSFSELDLSQTNNSDLFIMNLNVEDDADGLTLDLNCDGIDDLRIYGSVDDQSQGGGTNLLSKFNILTLNSSTFLLRDSTIENTFELTTLDTINFDINDYELMSSYQPSGAVLLYETTNYYVTNVDSTSILSCNDPRWTSWPQQSQIVRARRKASSTVEYWDGTYTHYITHVLDYRRGIASDQVISWIPIKFVTDEGNVKMGYIKLKPQLYEGAVDVGVDCWVIQR